MPETVYDLPYTPPGFSAFSLTCSVSAATGASPFTGIEKTYVWSAQVQTVELELPPQVPEMARRWSAWFKRIGLRKLAFWLPAPDWKLCRRSPGAPVLTEANQTGRTLAVSGFTPSMDKAFAAGILVQIGDRLHEVVDDVDTAADGTATVEVFPAVQKQDLAAATAIEWRAPKGKFRLAGNSFGQEWSAPDRWDVSGRLVFAAREIIDR
jgi:hypothetical protein